MRSHHATQMWAAWLWVLMAFLAGLLTLMMVGQALGVATPPVPQQEVFVISPVEGYFMVAENLGDPPLVVVGDTVEAGTVVGYVQSMEKTAIVAGVNGTVVEIMSGEMEPVAAGQYLMKVLPH